MEKQDTQPEPRNFYKVDLKKYETIKDPIDGSFGPIYFVRNKETHQKYVAKSMICEDKSFKQIINYEISIILQIHQPTLINYIGYSLEDFKGKKNVTILMEHIENGTLHDIIKKKVLDNTKRQIILVGIAHGMMTLHQHHILHHELTPYNVLLDSNLEPHLIDYGFSKIERDLSIYSSPETIKDNVYNEKTDVYSFGMLMYELVTNKKPFDDHLKSNKFSEFKKSICEQDLRPTIPSTIKKSIKELIERCWSPNPSERPTFDELFQRLSFNYFDVDFAGSEHRDKCSPRYFLENASPGDVFSYVRKISQKASGADERQIIELKSKLNAVIEKLNVQDNELKNAKKEIEQLKKTQQKSKDSVEASKNGNDDEIAKLRHAISEQQKAFKILIQDSKAANEKYEKKIESLTRELNELKSSQRASSSASASLTTPSPSSTEIQPKKVDEVGGDDDDDDDTAINDFNKAGRNLRFIQKSTLNQNVNNNYSNDSKIDLKGGIVKPFGIANIGATCYMNSSLQCLLSLSSFIDKLDDLISTSTTLKRSSLLSIFKNFIATHEPYAVKQKVGQTNEIFLGGGQQDSFEFTISSINTIQEESKKGVADLFIGNSKSITKCMKCLKESETNQEFSALSLSIQNSRDILYVPFSFKNHTINMFERPKTYSKVNLREMQAYQQNIGKFILVAKDGKNYKVIEDFQPQYANIYAFELPDQIKKGYGLTVVHLKDKDGAHITPPFICEVKIDTVITEDDLKSAILTRLKDVLSYEYKSKPNLLKKYISFKKPKAFTHKFSLLSPSDSSNLCSLYVTAYLTKKEAVRFTDRSTRNQRQEIKLSKLFESHVRNSQLDFPCKFTCDICQKKSRVSQRVKYTKLPKILIFQIKRSKGFYDNSTPDDTGVSLPHFVSIDLNGEFNTFKTDDDINDGAVKYELRAVSNHSGNFSFGHYTADAKRGGRWYSCNDSFVSDGFEPNKPSSNSYIAFYQQMS